MKNTTILFQTFFKSLIQRIRFTRNLINPRLYILIGFISINIWQSSAAIVYTDIIDYSLTTGGDYFINFDNSGATEARLVDYNNDASLGLYPAFMYLNFTTESAAYRDQLAPVALGSPIDANSGWFMLVDARIDSEIGGTPFPVGTDQYIGVEITDFGGINYGWVRVFWNGFDVFQIKDFAYESDFDTPINAGDIGGSVGISTSLNENLNFLSLAPNPASQEVIIISKMKTQERGKIDIYDLSGRVLFSSELTEELHINTSKWRNGLYQVYFRKEDYFEVKRLLVSH